MLIILVLFLQKKILKKIFLITILIICNTANAQLRHMFDSIKFDLKQKKKFFVSLDGKNNLVSDLNIKMFGLQGGYQYNRRTSLYVALYWTYNNQKTIKENPTAPVGSSDTNTVFSKYGLSYINFGCEYVFFNNKRWRLALPLAMGIGSGYNTLTRNEKLIKKETPILLPLEVGLNVSYKLKWWLWLGAGIGSRYSLSSNHDYNGAFYTFGLQLKTGEIYRRVKKLIDSK